MSTLRRSNPTPLESGDVRVLEMVASGAPLHDVLDTLVRIVEGSADGMLGSVLIVDDTARVRHGAAPSLPRAFVDAIDGEPIGPAAGSCGTAAYRREPVIVEDIATDPLWERYRPAALAAGLRASWSLPVVGSGGTVLGTFALYYTEPRKPTADLLALTQHATHLAAIAIERDVREQALINSETRSRQIIESALDANIIIDPSGTVISWSVRAAELFGWAAEEAQGRRLPELIIPEAARAQHDNGLARYRATGEAHIIGRRIEVMALHRDGTEFPVELAVTEIEDRGRRAYSAFVRDISARKRAESQLRDSEQHLSLVYEHVADVLFHIAVDPDGDYRFVALNPTFHRATGLTPAQVNGKRVRDVIPEPSLSLVLGKYAEAIRTRSTVRWDEVTVYPAGKRYGEVAVTPVFDADGRPKSLIGSVRDVTDRRRLEEEMRQLQKLEAIGRLTSGIAHDFNNILGVILMRANMALDDFQDATLQEELKEIVNAGERGAALTRQFLAFSRKQVMRPEVIDLNETVKGMQAMLRPLVGASVEFAAALAPDLWRVSADPSQVEQVIMNLVINSKDAMPAGGRLTIETANIEFDETISRAHANIAPGQYVMLAVTDTGMGMNEETRQQIFEPFFTTKAPGKGTGLGLATVYGIVKQSHGDIWVYSEPGSGTAIKVYFPRTVAELTPKIPRPVRRPSGKIMLGHVLVVEDEPALRDTLARLLPQLRCSVAVAANAADAVAMIDEGPEPDLVITDVVMPGMNGRELVQLLRKTRPTLKVLFISGYPDGAAANHGVIEPGTPFLQKPFSISDLSRCIEEALDTQG